MVRGQASYENTLRLSREAKRRRTGTCKECGATTRYNGGKDKPVSDLCAKCAAEKSGRARRGTGGNMERVMRMLAEPCSRSDLHEALGISYGVLDVTLNRLLGYGLIERVSRGVYRRVEVVDESSVDLAEMKC